MNQILTVPERYVFELEYFRCDKIYGHIPRNIEIDVIDFLCICDFSYACEEYLLL